MTSQRAPWLAVVRAALLGALAVAVPSAAPGGPPGATGPLGARRAPSFTVTDVAGQPIVLDSLLARGPVLLDFWATWCRPCLESMPELERWHRAYGPKGLTVVGVSVDGPRNYAKVRPMTASKGITYRVAIDVDGKLQRLYQVVAVPTAFLIDTSGVIARVRVAYRPGEGESLEREIRALLPAADVE